MTKPLVSIILLNWNGYEDTLEALESLYQINYPKYNVIVADNNSTNDSVEKIKEYALGNIRVETEYTKYVDNKPIKLTIVNEGEYSEIDNTSDENEKKLLLIKNNENYGFAKGNNIAIDYTIKYDNPDYILLLNNDTIVDPNFLEKMINVAQNDSKIGLLGPKFYYYDYEGSHETIWCIGSVVDLDHFPGHHSIMEEPDYDLTQDVIECDWVSGAGALIKTEAMPESYLSTEFFFGCEDVDLAISIKEKGYKVVTVMDSIIWHKVGMSRHKNSTFKTEYNHIKTNLQFIKKHKSNYYINLPKYYYQILKLYIKAIINKL
ncbi:glycosyltransferase family 2 protein [Methanosphaera sp.]|uniref:glycosyltransferase family 2 protein n=1 Tax=Methanosphaera sp. TaxID=2666342 RepID=UPI002E794C2B|nr:glycosyltransferase family 2 protein [Methanosphaera sp.]MEE1117089.1 glycosyltransferase family 2 protein [Methanosphaera sp.]